MTTEPMEELTDDSVPDGTQMPVEGSEEEEPGQEQDAGVDDTGDEPWYQEGDD
jgi:hypothetical protein